MSCVKRIYIPENIFIKEFLSILASREKLYGIMRDELVAVKDEYATPRLTKIEDIESVVDEVKQGETLSAAITRTEIFESMFCSVIYVGEESGALDSILEKTSEYYEDESDSAVERLVHMVEPIMLIFMGIIIALVVCGIYPALYGAMEGIEDE